MKSLSIRIKFILAFMAAGLAAIALVGIFTSVVSNQQFQNLVLDRLIAEISGFVTEYYATHGSLYGIEHQFRSAQQNAASGFENMFRSGIILVLPDRWIVLGDENRPAGTYISSADFRDANEVIYNDEIIAYLVTFNPPFQPNPQEARFLERTNRALIYASLIAVLLAIILGLIFTQALLKPLANLNTAISNMKNGELRQAVPETSDDELGEVIIGFNQMSTALAEANSRRDQMTADIAHELRSPLTVINGYLEAMQDGSLEVTQQRLSFIKNEVNQLNRLVDDLRTLALADAGELEINKEAISLQAIFTYLENAHILQANSKSIELLFEKEPSAERIFADEGRIIQVLSNLITNAIRHTPEGGSVTIKGYQHNKDISIDVADTGEGISAQDLDLVFDRFYRGDTSRLSTSGESGLGLSITKAIVEAHGGTIDVKSKVGEGTTFTVTLPHKPT